ncbi:MAG: type II CAAX endopeptidase family protein [Candidatus Thermoplasmatota archaeon]
MNEEKNRSRPWIFLIGTIIWTWGFYSIIFITGGELFAFPNVLFYALGGIGPLAISSILVGKDRRERDNTVGEFLKRSLDPTTLLPRWYLGALFLVILIAFLPLLFEPSTLLEKGVFETGPALFLLIGAIFGGLEEIGWRGYAQESLQKRMPILTSSLIIGLFWAVWHIPLFFMDGTYQATLGVNTMAFWAFNIGVIAGSPVYAWLYNSSGRVVFIAVFYHALGNILGELTRDGPILADSGFELGIALLLVIISWNWMKR